MLKKLSQLWRQNVALHATLITRYVTHIDDDSRELVKLNAASSKLKFRGTTEDGIEIYADIELIGPAEMLQQFKFVQGKHVGMVLRAID